MQFFPRNMSSMILFVIVILVTSCSSRFKRTNSQVVKQSYSLDSTHFYPDPIYEDDIQKAQISKRDSLFWIISNIKKDYRIFGYEKPDTNSARLIVFSVFTRDVENNPYKCPFGAFYGSGSLEDTQIKFKGEVPHFVMADLIIKGKRTAELFFEKKWIEFIE